MNYNCEKFIDGYIESFNRTNKSQDEKRGLALPKMEDIRTLEEELMALFFPGLSGSESKSFPGATAEWGAAAEEAVVSEGIAASEEVVLTGAGVASEEEVMAGWGLAPEGVVMAASRESCRCGAPRPPAP